MAVKSPGTSEVKLSPFRGFVSSRPRDEVGVDQFTGPSLDWLLARGRIRRRSGATIFGDTLTAGAETDGILESAIGFLARRMVSAKLPSVTDGYPAPLALFTEETTQKAATLAWRSTNGTDSWRTVGKEFSATHYPSTGLVHHRVVPLVYENQYGGLTLHRLTTATDRQFLAAGSREMLLLGGEVLLPSRTGVPVRWNRRFNDATGSGTEGCEVYPAGLIPPLQVPVVTAGTDLGASVQGPWKGADAFFYSIIFENERGELSMYPIPRPPGAAWSGFDGFGYFQVDSANPTHYFDSLLFSGIAVGPPGTKWVNICRTGKVDVTTTGAGAIVQPSIDDLQFISQARLPNGTTTYVDTDGNDLSLDPDPRITDMVRRGLMWPPCARVIGRFDGHVTLGDTSHNKYALIVAPWENGAINYKADDAALYGSVPYFTAVTGENLVLRKVASGSTTKVGETVSGSAVIGLPNLTDVVAGATISGSGVPGATTILNTNPLVDTGCQTTDGSTSCVVTNSANNRVGQLVRGPGIQPGTTVTAKPDGTHVTLSLPATLTDATARLEFMQATMSANASASATGVTFTISRTFADTMLPLAGETLRSLVDRVNADASVTNTTFTGATWSTSGAAFGVGIINLGAAPTGVYIGDTLISAAFPSGTKVVGIGTGFGGANYIGVDKPATRANTGASEAVTLQHRAGATSRTYAAGVVPGADMDADADNLLRTYVRELCTYGNNDTTLQFDEPSYAEFVTPGMYVSGTDIAAGAIVTAVNSTTGVVTISPASTGAVTGGFVEFYYDTGDATLATTKGHVRMFGNAFPVVLPWRKSYLDTFTAHGNDAIFSGASPGYAQDAPNTFFAANFRRGAPDTFGPLMGLADLGPLELQFFASGRLALMNTRTGETHNDADYTQVTRSWRRGLRSPYALDTWNGWAIFLSDEGFFATRGGYEADDVPLSADLYDRDRRSGSRGELEYAIEACVSASEGGTDGYRVHAQVHGSFLHVRYWTASTVGHVNREIRLDLTPVLGPERARPAWSTPLSLRHSVSCWVAKADGLHHYAARDSNAGTADGRVDEIDAGTTDNGTLVRPVGYSGTLMLDDLTQLQPLRFGVVAEKAGTGLFLGAARDSSLDHADMEFGDVAFPTSNGHDYGREILLISPGERVTLEALTVRIRDNGTGDPPEVSRAILYADPYEALYGQGG